MTRFRLVAGALAFVAGLVVGITACSAPGGPPEPVQWDDRLDLGVPGDVIDVVEAVEFYPACGNEVLTFDGQNWYPFTPAGPEDFPNPTNAILDRLSLGNGRGPFGTARGALPQVAAPGPGDDVGVLVIYEGGLAHWSADSGHLGTWLTTTALEYSWVC